MKAAATFSRMKFILVAVFLLSGLVAAGTVRAAAYFTDTVEGAALWTADAGSSWAVTSAAGSFHLGTKAWTDSPAGYYANNMDKSLVMTTAVDLSGAASPKLVFWHKYQLETDFDFGYVEISTDSGGTWSAAKLATYTGITGWRREQIDLADFAGQEAVKVRFRISTDKSIAWDGWFIDDVSIAEPPNAVVGLAVGNPQTTTLDLSWAASLESDFANYKIYRSITPDVSTTSALVATITDKSVIFYRDQNLTPETTYYYKIYLFNGNDLATGTTAQSGTTAIARFAYPFFDDMEGNVGGWLVTAPWGLTSEDKHSGSFAWTDSPQSAYAAGSDKSLQLSVDLGSSIMPVLSFWHRYNFETDSDYGYVEVREEGSTTWKRLYFATGTLAAWAEEKVDLSNYAGKKIDIRFRVVSDTNGIQADGWYIDDIRIAETAAASLQYPFIDNMETAGNWHSSSWGLTTDGRNGGKAFTDSPEGKYAAETDSELIFVADIDKLGNAGSHPQLSFWHKYDIYENDYYYCSGYTSEHDRGRVFVSTNKGQPGTWKELASYFGSQATWKREQIDLSTWAGLSDIRIKFVLSDVKSGNGNCNNRLSGWTIDDVVIEDVPVDVSLAITSSTMNSVALSWTQNADADFARYEIYRSASPGVTRSSVLVASIGTQATTSYVDSVAMVQPGVYYYRIWVVDDDGNVSLGSSELQASCSVPLNGYPFAENGEAGTTQWSWGTPWGLTETTRYEGSFAWAASSGNYPAAANTSLSTFLNLNGSTNPVLSFWHKYSLEEKKDFVYLEVSTDEGLTWGVLRTFTGTETAWNQERVNLTPYAGNARLGLRFRLTSDGQNQQEGWFMDNLTIKEESIRAAYPFSATMEDGNAPWFYDSQWEIVQLDAAGSRNGTASKVWSDSPGSYPSGSDSSLYLTIDLGSAQMPLLSFWHRYAFDANSDHGYVEVKEVGASIWKRLYFITGSSPEWAEARIDLTNYAGKQIDIRFRVVVDANGVQSDGWYMDDIRIGETLASAIPYPLIDGMETGGNWYSSSWSLTPEARSGNWSFTDSALGNYGAETEATLVMVNTIDLGGSVHPQLSFWHKYAIYENDYYYCSGYTSEHDRGRVYISTNKGQPGTWQELASYHGTRDVWAREQIDLSAWTGLKDVRIKFVMDDVKSGNGNCNNRLSGWNIDDVAMENAPVDVNLAIASSSMNLVALAWSKNSESDFDHYEIYRSSTPGVTRAGTLVATIDTQATEAFNDVVAMVEPGVYYYRAWVFDRDGNVSMGSNEVQASYNIPVNNYPFAEDGESGVSKWSTGSPWGLTDLVKHAGDHAWASANGNYPANANTTLSTYVNLSGSGTPVLTFWHRYSLEESKDFVRLEVSVDNGQTWISLKTYTGSETGWNQERVNLTPYAGNARLGLRFRLTSDGQNQQEGWFMDDLQIREEAIGAGYPFNYDAESAIAPWFYDSPWGVVQIAAAESRNNQETRVWSDSPGAYAANADTSLYINVDLGSARMPVLSFWHRYSFDNNSDYGYIEVREGGSAVWSRLYFITGTSSSWAEGRVDLANYAGKQIDVRFRVVADANGVQADGWYIDEIRVQETGTPVLPYPFVEDFENDPFAGRWLTSSWSQSVDANSGTYAITDSVEGNYGREVGTALILGNTLSLAGAVHPLLTFFHKYEIYNNDYFYCSGYTEEHDQGLVYISTNKGQPGTWRQIGAFRGNQTTWKKEQIDLSSWAGLPDVRVKFVMTDRKSNNGNCNTMQAGWTIDDVRIGEDESIPSYIMKISGDGQAGRTESPLENSFVVKVSDSQSRAQAGIQVNFEVTSGGGALSTLTGTTDSAGLVSTKLTLGSVSGANTVTATIPGTDPLQTVAFAATGYAVNQAMTLSRVSGDNQVYVKELALPNPLFVRVSDILGNPVSGAGVTFGKVSGEGTLSTTEPVTTDANGLASVSLTLGAATGVTTVSATASGLIGSPVMFTAYAVLSGGSLGDTDGDGMPDAWEAARGFDALSAADALLDADEDTLSNFDEYSRGTNPRSPDTDGDRMPDAWEVRYSLNPLDASDALRDADNDGVSNLQEYTDNTVPVYQHHFTVAAVTPDSMAAYGMMTIDGVAARPGDEIAAVCPDNIICGRYVVETPGQYGFMNIYGDDPATPAKDGASPGDLLTFRAWDADSGAEIAAVPQVVTGTNPPSWTTDGDIANINLNAAGRQVIPLRTGWNLMSFSVKNCYYTGDALPPAPMLDGINYIKVESIGAVLSSIAGKYDVVRSFDMEGAHTYDPALESAGFNTLEYLAGGYGYWIKMKEAGSLELPGLKVGAHDTLHLQSGWNLVGYWGGDVRYVENPAVEFPPDVTVRTPVESMGAVFGALADNYSAVRSFDGVSHIYVPSLPDSLNTLKYVGPGYGLWIKMKTPDELSY